MTTGVEGIRGRLRLLAPGSHHRWTDILLPWRSFASDEEFRRYTKGRVAVLAPLPSPKLKMLAPYCSPLLTFKAQHGLRT